MVGHTKSDHRMDRCWLRGVLGDALHAPARPELCGRLQHRWLMRAIAALGHKVVFLRLLIVAVITQGPTA